MENKNFVFAFFPYLKTSEPVHYRKIFVRDCDDVTGLPSNALQHLNNLKRMFFLRDHLRIQKMSYAFCASSEVEKVNRFLNELVEFQTLNCYFYSSPHPTSGEPFLNYEHSSLYIFQPKQFFESLLVNEHNVEVLPEGRNLKVNSRQEVDGYEGTLNNGSYLWVAEGSRVFPPTPHLWLNISQDLSVDFNFRSSQSEIYSPVIKYFYSQSNDDAFRQRLLTALDWYNKSIRIDANESESLINLAIAFESLLDLDRGEKLTSRFKEAIGLLVGNVERLDSWIIQFYNARSEIVHKGHSANMMFVPVDDPKRNTEKSGLAYRSLTSYGRQIFRVCVAAIVTGAQLANKLNLSSLLVTNRERFEKIQHKLSGDKDPKDLILSVRQDVYEIDNYRFVPENGLKVGQLISTTKIMIGQVLKLDPFYDNETMTMMQMLVTTDTKKHLEALSLVNEIQEKLRNQKVPSEDSFFDIHLILIKLIENVWSYTFMYYFALQDKQREDGKDKTS